MNSRQPDLCVGIDFGTTYTGVSWNTPGDNFNGINTIRQWPGEAGLEDKVPTVLEKDLLLDPKVHEKRLTSDGHEPWAPSTIDQLHELVTLYLSQVYTHISTKIPELIRADADFSLRLRLKTWDSLTIDFIFSTPLTWEAPVAHCFKDIISKAGFGEQKLHKVTLGLTEPEAAAVLTCQPKTVGRVHKDDVFLLINAGGEATDLAFVKAIANTAGPLTLAEVNPVSGVGVGFTRIDNQFMKLIDDRIKKHPKARSELPRNFAFKASQSDDFQCMKRMLGPKIRDWADDDEFVIRVPGLEKSYRNQGLGIQGGNLSITRQELESCFKVPLKEIKGLIKEALGNFEASNRRKDKVRHVSCVVVSGDLGSSDYVWERLAAHLNVLANEANSCLAGSKVRRVGDDARTAVVKGLLHDRRIKADALREHVAQANYGIIVEEPQPEGSAPSKNAKQYTADTTIFATDRIRWLVKSGETIQVGKPITLSITKRLEKSDQRKWAEKIVWLKSKSSALPKSVKDGWKCGMKELLSVDIEVHKGTKLSSGAPTGWNKTAHDKCEFELTLAVGPSGDCDVEVSDNVIKRSE
ncbi:hypothetical protein N0V84_002047 [Fusarium piperis]|uniref:Uncharacterized protein n=1 Tax=Fusarium piperis TaxID=1435070 RepID=A0A9W8WK36_9HYPO|nr:hypothetical protein N0V84_002047 [Fusarium piperis]